MWCSARRRAAVPGCACCSLLAGGDHIAITPDGPRGRAGPPRGVAQLAALSGVPVLPCAAQTTRRWVLRTWDRMVVPKPFGRGVVVCLPTIAVGRDAWQDALPAIGAALSAAADKADRLCRGLTCWARHGPSPQPWPRRGCD